MTTRESGTAVETASEPIRISIIEDERWLRRGLEALLDMTPGFICSATFASMEEALRRIDPASVDLVLTDIGLPRMDGIEGTRAIRERFPNLPVIVLTVHGEDDKIFQALSAGASGYLLKSTPPAVIIEAIRDVLNGGAPMSPEVARRVLEIFRTFEPPGEADYCLTEKEKLILKMLVEGHHYKTAAASLGITVSTVSFHLKNVYEKLHVHSKSEAVAKALREHLV